MILYLKYLNIFFLYLINNKINKNIKYNFINVCLNNLFIES